MKRGMRSPSPPHQYCHLIPCAIAKRHDNQTVHDNVDRTSPPSTLDTKGQKVSKKVDSISRQNTGSTPVHRCSTHPLPSAQSHQHKCWSRRKHVPVERAVVQVVLRRGGLVRIRHGHRETQASTNLVHSPAPP